MRHDTYVSLDSHQSSAPDVLHQERGVSSCVLALNFAQFSCSARNRCLEGVMDIRTGQ